MERDFVFEAFEQTEIKYNIFFELFSITMCKCRTKSDEKIARETVIYFLNSFDVIDFGY